jgi:hypothetical protein
MCWDVSGVGEPALTPHVLGRLSPKACTRTHPCTAGRLRHQVRGVRRKPLTPSPRHSAACSEGSATVAEASLAVQEASATESEASRSVQGRVCHRGRGIPHRAGSLCHRIRGIPQRAGKGLPPWRRPPAAWGKGLPRWRRHPASLECRTALKVSPFCPLSPARPTRKRRKTCSDTPSAAESKTRRA